MSALPLPYLYPCPTDSTSKQYSKSTIIYTLIILYFRPQEYFVYPMVVQEAVSVVGVAR